MEGAAWEMPVHTPPAMSPQFRSESWRRTLPRVPGAGILGRPAPCTPHRLRSAAPPPSLSPGGTPGLHARWESPAAHSRRTSCVRCHGYHEFPLSRDSKLVRLEAFSSRRDERSGFTGLEICAFGRFLKPTRWTVRTIGSISTKRIPVCCPGFSGNTMDSGYNLSLRPKSCLCIQTL
jgi:hypothetical protein